MDLEAKIAIETYNNLEDIPMGIVKQIRRNKLPNDLPKGFKRIKEVIHKKKEKEATNRIL